MFLLLLVSSLGSLFLCAPHHRYILVQSPKTWFEAQSYCRENCFDLATINDMGEMTMALTAVNNKYTDAVWTGLIKQNIRNWYWSLADDDFYKEGERNYFDWAVDQLYNCAFFKDGKLYTSGCGDPYYSICFDASQKDPQNQYVLILQMMNWMAARDNCRSQYMDLVSVRNAEESQILQNLTAGQSVWIGLFRDPWVWSDQTYSSFRYWKPSLPVYTDIKVPGCGALIKSEAGKWGDLSCIEVHPFLCSCPITRFINVRIISQASKPDLNEPAVQKDILQQMLINKNVSEILRVKWKKHPDGRVFTKEQTRGGNTDSCCDYEPH